MGMSIGNVKILLNEIKRLPFNRLDLLSLGRMNVCFSYNYFQQIVKEYHVQLSPFNIIPQQLSCVQTRHVRLIKKEEVIKRNLKLSYFCL